MKTQSCQLSAVGRCGGLVFVLVAMFLFSSTAGAADSAEITHQLLSAGQSVPTSENLKVWTETAGPDLAKAGIPAIVRVKSAEKAYLTAVYLSASGDAIVLLPNRDTPAVLMQPNTEYTLFGPASQLKLAESEISKSAKIVFFLSSTPLEIDPSRIPATENFVRISKSSSADMSALGNKLETLAKSPAFNMKVLALSDNPRKGSRLDLMGLPADATSAKPTGVTGVSGLKSKIIDVGQE